MLKVNDSVKVLKGPFAGTRGVVDEVHGSDIIVLTTLDDDAPCHIEEDESNLEKVDEN